MNTYKFVSLNLLPQIITYMLLRILYILEIVPLILMY